MPHNKTKVLGIDPGTSRIGYGLIEKVGGDLRHIESGLLPINPEKLSDIERLTAIRHSMRALILRTAPDMIGVEKLFFTKNKKTAMRVAEARGVILEAAAEDTKIIEVSPVAVKIAVTGDGRAGKKGVAKMVNLILKLPPRRVVDDVTDALAIAIAASSERF